MDEQIVDIYDISYEGAGVGRIDNKIVFVPKTLKNEKVRVKVVKSLSSFLLAEIEELICASDKRIVPKCKYFNECGGCNFQHCGVSDERQIKLDILTNQLAKVGYSGEIGFVESENRFSYRNKLKLEVFGEKLGFFKAKTRDFVEIERCEIALELINDVLPDVKRFIAENRFEGLKSVYIKEVGGKLGICFLFPKNFEKVIKKVRNLERLEGNSVFFAFGNVLESNSTSIFNVLGSSKLEAEEGDLKYDIEVSAFNQVNKDVAEKLYTFIEQKCVGKRVVNAYSGQGLLTFRLAKVVKFVYGIEYQISAHEASQRLCNKVEEYKIKNICGKVEDCLGDILLRDRIDCIVLDPAKEGCDKKVLQALVLSGVSELIYVSCNFSTLVRDIMILKESYTIENVTIFNMFPCCVNMETVVCLKRKT